MKRLWVYHVGVCILAVATERPSLAQQGACVLTEAVPLYKEASGEKVAYMAPKGFCVAGVKDFEKKESRVHVVYFANEEQQGTPSKAWMNPADLDFFVYDCSCDPTGKCAPIKRSWTSVWVPCFVEARDKKLAEGARPGGNASQAALPHSGPTTASCRPDVFAQDQIAKQPVELWRQTVDESDVGLAIFVGNRIGMGTQIGVLIERQEQAATTNTNFQTALRAAKGNQFFFGLKNSEPLAFVADEVSNEAKVSGSVMAGFSGRNLYTTVRMWAVVPDETMATLRETLSRKPIDAVRVVLAGDTRIEKSVTAKNGTRLMEKFECFYQSLDRKGIDLSAAAPVPRKTVPARVEMPQDVPVPVTIRLGMTPEQVEAAMGGRPQKIIDLGKKKIFVFPDMKISFEDGKVSDVQ